MSEEMGYLSGEVSDATVYQPVPKGRYRAVIVKAEVVDPIQMNWDPPDEMPDDEREEYLKPYPRMRWQIEAAENGEPTEYAGRIVDQRVSLRSGVNTRTGHSYAETRSDLIRLRMGLDAKTEVRGQKLFDDADTKGLPREEAVPLAQARLASLYEGLRGVVRVTHMKNKGTGEFKDAVAKIILPG